MYDRDTQQRDAGLFRAQQALPTRDLATLPRPTPEAIFGSDTSAERTGLSSAAPGPDPEHEEQAATDVLAIIFALQSGVGSLIQRMTSRAFLLTLVGLIPSLIAGLSQLQGNLPVRYAEPIYLASFVLGAIYIVASRWENVQTAKTAGNTAVALKLAERQKKT